MSKRYNSFVPQNGGGQTRYSTNGQSNRSATKYFNENASPQGGYYNQKRYKTHQQYQTGSSPSSSSSSHHLSQSPNKRSKNVDPKSERKDVMMNPSETDIAVNDCATVPACGHNQQEHLDGVDSYVPSHSPSMINDESPDRSQPLSVCTAANSCENTQPESMIVQQQQYIGFSEYDASTTNTNVSPYMAMTMSSPPPPPQFYHHPMYQQQSSSPPMHHPADFAGYYSPVYQAQQQFQAPPFQMYEQPPTQTVFMSPQPSTSQGNLFHTPQQTTQPLYLTTPPSTTTTGSSECLVQQQDMFAQQQQTPYIVYHPYGAQQHSPSQTSLLTPPGPGATPYPIMYHPATATTPSPTPSSSMIQLVPNQHQTTPTTTRYYNRSSRLGAAHTGRRFYDQHQQQQQPQPQHQQPAQDEASIQFQQQMQMQVQMQQQQFYTLPYNPELSQCQSPCMDPNMFAQQIMGTADPCLMGDMSHLPAVAAAATDMIDSYGPDLDEEETTSNGEQLACYVCRGRRMCFCYFLKVRYYKFPSFLDLVDHQYKKWRSHMAKNGRQQS